ncbi:MAG TPA: MFS transporter [Solirubrobacteraceae bacterium]|nr:MFS transporter [Solirubrobacteraceae bacterium]
MASSTHPPGTSGRWWALGGLSLAVLAVGLDATLLSVALPTLARSLRASESDLQWFSSGYLLVLAAAMLPAGVLGDRYGRKRLLIVALGAFAVGSAASAAAVTAGEFIAARVLLGIAGAGVIVMALAVLAVLFSEQERPKAVGVWAAANFLALPLGPIFGGWLLTHFWWGWAFLVNIPVAGVGMLATAVLVPESRALRRPRLDGVGMLASVAGLVALTYGLIRAGQHGWGSTGAVALIAAGVALLGALMTWERRLGRRGGEPLIDPALSDSRAFVWGVLLAALAGVAMIGVLFTMPQYFQGVRGTNAMGSGVRLLPLVGGLIVGALPAEGLAHRLGAKAVVGAGFALLTAGLAIGSTTSLRSSGWFGAGWMALAGVGLGLAFATSASAAVAELPEEKSGVGAAVMQALQKTGGPFGAAILGSVLSAGYLARLHLAALPPAVAHVARESVFGAVAVATHLGDPRLLHTARAAFVHGMDQALLVSAVIGLAGAVLAAIFLPAGTSSPSPAGRPEAAPGVATG